MSASIDTLTMLKVLALTVTIGVLFARFGRPDRALDRLLFGVFAGTLLVRYALWRTTQTLPDATHGLASVWPYLFYAFEMIAIVYTLGAMVVMVRRRDARPYADDGEAMLRRMGDRVPPVDVFIATYNEELEVLEKTIVAAKNIDYPHVNVWVLDDTRRDWLRDYCRRMGVHYARRPDNAHAKAGNLNNGLKLSAGVTGAPFILVLDADFAAQRNILYRVLGLFAERRVGLVQTPQFYFNADPIQHNLGAADSWVDEQRVFFDVFQPSRDAWDSAFCVGTSFVISRHAITEAGGFPTGSVCEDIHTTYLLRKQGYITRWLNERLSVGMSAEGLVEYINQRSRWCLGTLQVAMLKDGPLRDPAYTLGDKLHYLHGMLHWLSKPFLLMMLIAPLLYWYFGIPAFHTTPAEFMYYGVPGLVGYLLYGPWITERRTLPLFTEVTQLVAAYAVTMTIVRACIKPFGHPFKVTAKGIDRSRVMVHWKLAGFFIALMFFLQVGAVNSVMNASMTPGAIFNLAWTLVALLLVLAAIMACVDLPRPQQEERFPFDHPSRWRAGRFEQDSRLIDISLSGAALRRGREASDVGEPPSTSLPHIGLVHRTPPHPTPPPPPPLPPTPPPPAVGEPIAVRVPDVGWVPGTVARITRRRLCVAFRLDEPTRHRLIRRIFCHAPHNIAARARPLRAAWRFLSQAGLVFRPRSTR